MQNIALQIPQGTCHVHGEKSHHECESQEKERERERFQTMLACLVTLVRKVPELIRGRSSKPKEGRFMNFLWGQI